MRTLFMLVFALVACNFSHNAVAHELSTSFISAHLDDSNKLNGFIKVQAVDIKESVALDVNGNGELTWGEIQSAQVLIFEHVSQNVVFSVGERICPLDFAKSMMLQEQNNSPYLVLPFSAQCSSHGDLRLHYTLFFDLFSNHKAIVTVTDTSNEYLSLITQAQQPTVFNLASTSSLTAFTAFIYQGILHILIGLDHILFLTTLLLTVCLLYKNKKWQAIESIPTIIKRTLWIVTSFTIAHSITLSGTALGLIPTFGPWIEVVIAASILFNVINNIFPVVTRLGIITFAFGLIHGMGFAGALADVGLPENNKLVAVLAFNIGVELGQIGLLMLILPILIKLREAQVYRRILLPLSSLAIGALAVYWILTRL